MTEAKIKTVELAKDIVFLCKQYNHDYNNTKIQKLMYLFLGFCLRNNLNIDLDDEPKLWPYGPVFPKSYAKYKKEIEQSTHDKIFSITDDSLKEILALTVQKWGKVSAGKLSSWSHEKDSPWDILTNELMAEWNTPIPLFMIKQYFEERIQNVKE